jgi:tetratricopeptide (TPR) repeat protein
MKKIICAGMFLLSFKLLFGQDLIQNLSKRQASDLTNSLVTKLSDSVKADRLLRLALYNILKPGSAKRDLDSARNFIHQAEPIIARLRTPVFDGFIDYVRANLQRETGDQTGGKQFAEKAVADLKGTNDAYHIALAYYELAQYFNIESAESVKARAHLVDLSVNTLRDSKHIELKGFLMKNLAELYLMSSQNSKALQTIVLSLASYQSIHSPRLQGVYTVEGTINFALGNYHQALANMFAALSAAENQKDTTMQLCQIYNVIGFIYDGLYDQKSSIPFFNKALEIAQRNKDETAIYQITINLVASLGKLKDYKNALLLLKRVGKANPQFAKIDNYAMIPVCY